MKLTKKTIARNLSISLALIGGVALAPQALAERSYALAFEPTQVRSVESMQRLHAEIQKVAKSYCPTARGLQAAREVRSCRAEVAADLVSKVAQPAFSAFVESQSRRSTPALIAATN